MTVSLCLHGQDAGQVDDTAVEHPQREEEEKGEEKTTQGQEEGART